MRSVVWCGPTFQPTGYADEVRGMALALHNAGTEITLVPPALESSATFRNSLDPAIRRVLEQCVKRSVAPGFIQVQHGTIDSFSPPNEHAAYSIGRSMFETDSLPSHWVVGANALDELWIPGEFNRQTFAKAGVRTPMHVIPGGIDSQTFRPDIAPMAIPGVRGTVFLSVFEWRLRKGWDVLLRAWADAFTPGDGATLVLRTYPISRADGLDNVTVIRRYIDEYLQSHCGGRSRADVAPIVILGDPVPSQELPSLYTAAHAFVLPTRGEGWGRPFMESMACGVPVMATNWSAHLAFLNNNNGYLIDVDGTEMADCSEVPSYAGQRWASPSATHLTALLRRVHRDRAEALHLGLQARRHMVDEWPWSRVADAISVRLNTIHAQLDDTRTSHTPVAALAKAVQVEGPAPDPCAPESNVALWLAAAGSAASDVNVRLPVVWREKDRGPRPPYSDVMFPFWQGANTTVMENAVLVSVLNGRTSADRLSPPLTGAWVVDTGSTITDSVPPHLVTLLRDQADIVVVPSATARARCEAAGISAHRIHIVSPAVDPDRFSSTRAAFRGSERASTCFLLHGDDREHNDWARAIAAYERAFTADDDVLLRIVAPPGRYAPLSDALRRLTGLIRNGKRHPRLPRIVIQRGTVHHDEIPSLFQATDVFLYTGIASSSAKSLREAMASGTTIIATDTASVRECLHGHDALMVPVDTRGHADLSSLQQAMRDASRDAMAGAVSEHASAFDRTGRNANRTSLDEMVERWTSQQQQLRDIVSCALRLEQWRVLGDAIPASAIPLPLAGAHDVVIVAHASWHTGMAQSIVRTYATAFSAQDDVTLALCIDPAQGIDFELAERMVRDAINAANIETDAAPDVLLIPDMITDDTLHQLRAAATLVVAIRDHAAEASARRTERGVITSLNPDVWLDAVNALRRAAHAA